MIWNWSDYPESAQSLNVEAHKPSLYLPRLKLSLDYFLRLKCHPENPAYSCVFEHQNAILFEASPAKIPPLGLQILPHLKRKQE